MLPIKGYIVYILKYITKTLIPEEVPLYSRYLCFGSCVVLSNDRPRELFIAIKGEVASC